MKILFLILAMSLIGMTPAFAELGLSNQRIISLDGNVILEFGDNTRTINRNFLTVTPNLNFGIIQLVGGNMFLSGESVNILGNSFSVQLDNGKIYAQNNNDGTFEIRTLTVENGKFQKQVFDGIMEPITTSFEEIIPTEPIVIEEKPVTDLLLLGKYTSHTAINDRLISISECLTNH